MPVSPALLRHRRLIGLLVFLLALAWLAYATGLRSRFSVPWLQQLLQDNLWTGLTLFVLLFCAGNIFQVPGWIFLAAAVLAFGRGNGGLATYVAANLSCLFTFVTVRLLGGNVAATLQNPYALRLLTQLQAHPVRNVVLLRTLFKTLPPLNYALALSGLKLRHYVLGTLLGLPLPIAVYCLFFDYLIKAAHQL